MRDDPWEWFHDDLQAQLQRGLGRRRRDIFSAQGARIRYRGREFVNFSSNDYLDLAADPRLARAAMAAARKYGTGAGASPLVSGYLPPVRKLERDLARWEGAEAALVFSSGYAANLAAVSTLAARGDAIFSDQLNHASLIDGSRLSRARVHVYRHSDPEHLESLLREHGSAARHRLVVTDGLFSMDGDLAPLAELIKLANRHDYLLLVDEAHATGVLGAHGRGVSELAPATNRLVKLGTLSKALGSQGGFICGSGILMSWLVHHCRPYIFSTALAPPAAAAARQALRIVAAEPERRQRVLALAESLRAGLQKLGYAEKSRWRTSCSQIVPIVVGGARAATQLSARLERLGLLVPAIRPPSVPAGTSRLRISLTAGHTEEDVARLLDGLRSAG